MKKLSILFALLVLFACEASLDSSLNPGSDTGQGGSTARFAVVGNLLFTVDNNSLQSFDVSIPASPTVVNKHFVGQNIETIFPRDNYLFIGSQNGVFLYQVQNGEPVYVSNVWHIVGCDPVVANDTHAYVTIRTGTVCRNANQNLLMVLRLNEMNNMAQVNEIEMENPKGLGIMGNYLLVCDGGLKVYDITERDFPKFVRKHSIDAEDLIPMGDRIMVVGKSGFAQYSFAEGDISLLSTIPVLQSTAKAQPIVSEPTKIENKL